MSRRTEAVLTLSFIYTELAIAAALLGLMLC